MAKNVNDIASFLLQTENPEPHSESTEVEQIEESVEHEEVDTLVEAESDDYADDEDIDS